MNISKILKYWTFCELSDFVSFKLIDKKIIPFNIDQIDKYPFRINKFIKDEYNFNKEQGKDYIDKYKKIDINKVYLGLIKKDVLIKYIANKLCEDFDAEIEDSIEKLKLDEYTYLAYIYLDYKNDLISINGKSLVVNPIFYVLKYLNNKSVVNNIEYKDFALSKNQDFKEHFRIKTDFGNIIVPTADYILEKIKIYDNNTNPFYFWKKENTVVLILSSEVDKLKLLAQSNEKALTLSNYIENEIVGKKVENVLFMNNANTVLVDTVKTLAEKDRPNFIYYLLVGKSEQINKNIEIPQNVFIYDFLKSENILGNIFSTSDIRFITNYLDIQKYVLKLFDFNEDLLYRENDYSIFYSKELNKTNFDTLDLIEKEGVLSFYLDALEEEPSKLTELYILGKKNKLDVNRIENRISLNSLDYFKEANSKWASEYPLYYAQQMAVNIFMSRYNKNNNIFSVNGPPGTGKTTLLKDIIANIHLRKIDKLFEENFNIFEDDIFSSDFVGNYEILVTSNNNSAVENISVELPKIDKFDLLYTENEKPFLLQKYSDEFYEYKENSQITWGIFSIRLGNSKNIRTFKDSFNKLIENINNDKKDLKELSDFELDNRFNELKKRYITIKEQIKTDEFEFASLDNIKNKKKVILEINLQINTINEKIRNTENLQKEQLDKNKLTQDELIKVEELAKIYEKRLDLRREELDNFGVLSRLIFKRNKYTQLKEVISSLINEFDNILNNILNIKEELNNLEQVYINLSLQIEGLKKSLNQLNDHLIDLKENLKQLELIYRNKKYYICDEEFFYLKEEKIQKDEKIYNKERYRVNKSKLFVLSLQISEILFIKNLDKFKVSINYYLNNYKRTDLSIKEKEELQNQFSSLFFIFPVVSTALASSYTMLKNIKIFGTVICDESGQATPQSIIGCFNRAKNALIVGDPLQVEPVFTAPEFLIKIFNQYMNINNKYSPLESSVQSLSDEANDIGSYYKVNNKDIWVGMPLVVHSRCLEPMFSITNHISYNNKMISATNHKENKIDLLPGSCWIDVVSSDEDFIDNSSRKEMLAVNYFIGKYKDYIGNVFIISPFKSIHAVFNKNNLTFISEIDKNTKAYCGTVHTFQGREEDLVFLVLGGNNKKFGAKSWASKKANILNVALSRAKKRVYIVGNHKEWSKMDYFNFAADKLEKVEIETILI